MEIVVAIGLLFLLAAAAAVSSVVEERRNTREGTSLRLPLRGECGGEFLRLRSGEAPDSGRASRPSPPQTMVRDFSIVSLGDAFDPETACIWEPQIEILRHIGEEGERGLEVECLRPVLREIAGRYPELYEGSDLESWLEAMESAELIAWKGPMVRLTRTGAAFLKCRLPVTA